MSLPERVGGRAQDRPPPMKVGAGGRRTDTRGPPASARRRRHARGPRPGRSRTGAPGGAVSVAAGQFRGVTGVLYVPAEQVVPLLRTEDGAQRPGVVTAVAPDVDLMRVWVGDHVLRRARERARDHEMAPGCAE